MRHASCKQCKKNRLKESSTDGKAVPIQNQSRIAQSHRYQRRDESFMQTHYDSIIAGNIIKLIKQPSMTPTVLEYSWCATNPIATAVFTYVLFICIAMITSVLIVCFTAPVPKAPQCKFQLSLTVQYSNRQNSHPHSIAIGDFNNDGHADIVVAKFGFDNVSVILGYGNNSLATQITHSTGIGSAPRMVAVGHFNHDNQLDVAVANFGNNNVMILYGNGSGHFSHQTTIDTSPSRPRHVAVGNFDNDEHADIAFIGHGTNSIGIILRFDNGTFERPMYLCTGYDSLPYSLALGDVNGDGQLDIVVANYGTNNIGLFFGYGNGTFSRQITYTTGTNSRPYSLALSHLNNNGHLDIAVVNSNTDEMKLFFDYENGLFNTVSSYSTGENSSPIFIAIADLNNDNKSDITVLNNATNSLLLYFGYGNRTFKEPVSYSTGPRSSPYSIGIADFNDDRQLDVAVANHQNNNIKIFDSYTSQVLPREADFSTDSFSSRNEILPSSSHLESDLISIPISYLSNDSQPTVTHLNLMKKYLSVSAFCPMMIAVGHLNNDRQLDIAIVDEESESIGILLGNGDGTFHVRSVLSTGNGSNPYAIVLKDFNNDGRLDIAVANYDANNVAVFLQDDNDQYSPQMTYPTGNGSRPMSLAVADFNNDHQLDIAIVYSGTSHVGVLLGNGSGTFLPPLQFSVGVFNRPVAISVGDFNNDGRPDLAVAIRFSNTVGILLGHSREIFEDIRMFSAGFFSFPASLAVGDFNSDGHLDIAVGNTNNREEHVLILLGDGNGNFSPHAKFMTKNDFKLCSLVVGHFNGDRRLDIAVVHINTMEIGVFFGYGNGTFAEEIEFFTGHDSEPVSIAVGDFNNDNLTDLAVANHGTFKTSIFLAAMDTRLIDSGTWSTGSAASPGAIALGDFDNNGHLDIIVGNEGTQTVDILLNEGKGRFSIHTVHSEQSKFYPTSIVTADFNNDNQPDIAVADSIMNTINVFYGQGNGRFENLSISSTGMNSYPQSIASGDFNGDNRTDLVVAHTGTGSIGLFLKIDSGALESRTLLPTSYQSKPHGINVADFDNDGYLDIAVGNNGNANIGFFFGRGDGTFSEQKIVFLGKDIYPIWVGLGDFNNDGLFDVVVSSNVEPSPVTIVLSNGDRSFRLRRIDSVNLTYMGAVGDLNTDGYLDMVLCQPWFNVFVVLLGNGDGTFRDPVAHSTGEDTFPSAIVVSEFNNDSRPDIAVVNHYQLTVGVFLGHGDGTFSSQTIYSTRKYGVPVSITAGDFNNDNRMDIVVGIHGRNNTGILFGNDNGTFSSLITNPTGNGSLPKCIAAVDLNHDGQLDILVTNSDSNNIGVILSHVNGSFFNEINYWTGDSSYPYWMGFGDFNNDSRLDIAVANMLSDNIAVFLGYATENFIGTATKQIGRSSQPVGIAVGDLNGDTYLDIVVADRRAHQIVVLEGSGYGTFTSQQIYSTGSDSYPNWVAVHDFNHDQYLDIVVANSGTSNIAVLLGNGKGAFSNSIKSSTGKSSSPLSLCVGYFNNDTHVDIAVADFDTNNVCLLFGSGNGYFRSLECRTSGYDSRPFGIASGDMNGDNRSDVVITNKGSSTVRILTEIC